MQGLFKGLGRLLLVATRSERNQRFVDLWSHGKSLSVVTSVPMLLRIIEASFCFEPPDAACLDSVVLGNITHVKNCALRQQLSSVRTILLVLIGELDCFSCSSLVGGRRVFDHHDFFLHTLKPADDKLVDGKPSIGRLCVVR